MKKYILDKKRRPIEVDDIHEWGVWFENSRNDRKIGSTTFFRGRMQIHVSTVFLALDHGFSGGDPILWETMVFGGKLDQEQDRCSGSVEQAEAMHSRMVEKVIKSSWLLKMMRHFKLI